MTRRAAEFAFVGSAFLNTNPERLAELAKELGDSALIEAVESAPAALEPEYNRLFLNPAGSLCSLWQSAHVGERRLMGEPHLRALEWYRRYAVEPVLASDPADHIGLLLVFFARMLAMEASAVERSAFAADHLAWIPDFCGSVLAEARHPFYRLVAERTRELVTESLILTVR